MMLVAALSAQTKRTFVIRCDTVVWMRGSNRNSANRNFPPRHHLSEGRAKEQRLAQRADLVGAGLSQN
jgi:hypothetical protein